MNRTTEEGQTSLQEVKMIKVYFSLYSDSMSVMYLSTAFKSQ